ncbi:hypothetical protein FRB90_002473 [Tulasnella sp. 427]|nr:hypothetical protein FRB90_002473 [Tulasnella sp. 427]
MIFAFGPNDGWYFNDRKRSVWRNLPTKLNSLLKDDPRFATGKITSLVLFPNGGYYMTALNGQWATLAVPTAIEKELETPAAKASVQRVEIDSANPTTFLVRTDNAEFLQHEVPRKCLEVVLRKYAIEGVRDIALGYNGSYVVLGKGTKLSWLVGDWDWLNKQLKGPKAVKNVWLSPYDARRAVVEFTDGGWGGAFPQDWLTVINKA